MSGRVRQALARRRGAAAAFSQDAFNPRLHHDPASVPAGAAATLVAANPRLEELQQRYAALDWPVGDRSRWRDAAVDQWLNLLYFRGESMYMWHYRDTPAATERRFAAYLDYILERDQRGLTEALGEDGAFGCWTYAFEGRPVCSRDLLDSVNELLFLDRWLGLLDRSGQRLLDIGAGYGRLAHRACQAMPALASYTCVDAIAESTFLSEYYLDYRQVAPPAQVIELGAVPALRAGSFDLALNIHSFSECPKVAIEWWLDQLDRLEVPHLFVVPNEAEGFLSTEPNGQRLDYLESISARGYAAVADDPVIADPATRDILGVHDHFWLFAR